MRVPPQQLQQEHEEEEAKGPLHLEHLGHDEEGNVLPASPSRVTVHANDSTEYDDDVGEEDQTDQDQNEQHAAYPLPLDDDDDAAVIAAAAAAAASVAAASASARRGGGSGGGGGPARGPSSLRRFLDSRPALLLLYAFFFAYLVVVPLVLVLSYYLDGLQVVVCIVCALGLPGLLYHFLFQHEVARQREAQREQKRLERQLRRAGSSSSEARSRSMSALSLGSPHGEEEDGSSSSGFDVVGATLPAARVYDRPVRVLSASALSLASIFAVVSKQYVYELYQLLLTLLSCALYVVYTMNLRFVWTLPQTDAQTGEVVVAEGHGDYTLSFADQDTFVQMEYFLSLSLSLDYLLRMLSAPEKAKFLFNHYSIIDLLCFSAVYAGFWHRQLAPSDAIYNVYLLQAPFRFLRFRRALQSLDKPVRSAASSGGRGADELAIYRLGPLMLSRRTAFLVLLVLRVVLFICSAASLFLALEFPCEALVDASIVPDCSAQLRRFHVAVYFTVVTLSTVGYGDVSAKTDAGRIMVTAFIISALVAVPREIQKFSDLETEVRAKEEEIKRRITEERNRQQQQRQQQQQQLAGAASSSSAMVAPDGQVVPLFPTSPSIGTAGSGGNVSSSAAVLGAFLADDRALLVRWCALQLASSCAAQPHLLPRLRAALQLDSPPTTADAAPAASDHDGASPSSATLAAAPVAKPPSLEQQCAQIASLLFGAPAPAIVPEANSKELRTRSPSPASSSGNSTSSRTSGGRRSPADATSAPAGQWYA
jgi:hypothetical protein